MVTLLVDLYSTLAMTSTMTSQSRNLTGPPAEISLPISAVR